MPIDHASPQSCTRCRLRPDRCVCALAPHLDIATRLVVIMHAKEWGKSTNTGHLARLAINGAGIRLHGLPRRIVSSVGIDSDSASTLVLFPGRDADTLTARYIASLTRPITLLVPDGNWHQAKSMSHRLPMLRHARPVRLGGSDLDFDGLRNNDCADHMSTFEAIAQSLGVIEGQATQDRLLAFFRQVLAGRLQRRRATAGRTVLK